MKTTMEKISKNCYKGSTVKTPYELIQMALDGESFYQENWGIKPAAILISMQFRIVMDQIQSGRIFRVINKSKAA